MALTNPPYKNLSDEFSHEPQSDDNYTEPTLMHCKSEYPSGNVEDRRMLEKSSNEKLLNFLFLQVRNLWRVDGLYFLDIEKKSGTEAAAQIDAQVWKTPCIQLESHL